MKASRGPFWLGFIRVIGCTQGWGVLVERKGASAISAVFGGEWRRTMYTLMAATFVVYASMMMIFSFLPLYLQTMGITDTGSLSIWTGVIDGAPFFIMFFVSPFWGRFADRFGCKWMVVRAAIGAAIVTFLMAWVTSPWLLLLLRLVEGAVCGFLPVAMTMMSAAAPPARLQYALGMLQAGFVVGFAMGPLAGGWLVSVFQDPVDVFAKYRDTFLIAAAVLVTTVVVALTLREEKGDKKSNEGAQAKLWVQSWRLFRQRPLGRLLTISFFVPIAVFSYVSFLSIFLQYFLVFEDNIEFWIAILWLMEGLAIGMASPIVGKWGDRWGSYRVLCICLVGVAVFLVSYALATSKEMLSILCFPLGWFMAGITPSLSALLTRAAPQGELGSVYGLQASVSSLGQGIGPLLLGLVSAMIGGVKGLQAVFVVAGLISLGIFLCFLRSSALVMAGEKAEGEQHPG